MAKNDFQTVLYCAVGVFTRAQRKARDATLLKRAKGSGPRPSLANPVEVMVTGDPFVTAFGRLRVGIRYLANSDDKVSLDVQRFRPSWPGKTKSGKPKPPATAFRQYLASAEGKAMFGNATSVALYAIDVDIEIGDR